MRAQGRPGPESQPLTTDHPNTQPILTVQEEQAELSRRLPGCPAALHSPLVLDVLIDHACNEHGDQGIVPGGDKHESQAETHA